MKIQLKQHEQHNTARLQWHADYLALLLPASHRALFRDMLRGRQLSPEVLTDAYTLTKLTPVASVAAERLWFAPVRSRAFSSTPTQGSNA